MTSKSNFANHVLKCLSPPILTRLRAKAPDKQVESTVRLPTADAELATAEAPRSRALSASGPYGAQDQ